MNEQLQKMHLSFDKTQRLLTPAEFRTVFDKPYKKIHSEHLLLFVGQACVKPRLGLAITKKKIKNASDRNHLKRQTRELFRINQHQLPCVDCVLIVKKNPFINQLDKKLVMANLRQELVGVFAQLAKFRLHDGQS